MKNTHLITYVFHLINCCFLLFCTACGGPARERGDKSPAPEQNQDRQAQRIVLEDGEKEAPPKAVAAGPENSASGLESRDPSDLEAILFRALNQERKNAGLSQVRWSNRLAAVAREYSQEMVQTGIVAHISKISGSPSDRLADAHIRLPGVSENLAKAATAKEAHLGLMNSPGHRANILDIMAAEVGVGVALTTDNGHGGPAVIVTQIFSLKPKPIDEVATGGELVAIINRLRKDRGLGPLRKHPWLTRTANEISVNYSKKGTVEIPALDPKFERVSSMVLKTMIPAQSIQSVTQLMETEESHIGISTCVCRDKKMDQDMVCVIVLLGTAIR
ncbi:MAG: CAP domain-containing protein [Proteobacteria bacterium]|nr:CAP domain-containing protein [Pseudomonadota bacterium]